MNRLAFRAVRFIALFVLLAGSASIGRAASSLRHPTPGSKSPPSANRPAW
ncbi:MAG: hypothetical protein MPW14_18175 [Candidatus Manganitrophus sp.]|nr:MAG: hypothetical protein MPW14_18175 [Candidatus Manganitrophus sp.]